MISGGIQPGSLVNARAIICEAPDPKMQSDCIEALEGVKTGDNADKPVLHDIIYFCGHDPDTFQQMTDPEKTRATACNIDVFKQPSRYKQGDASPASVTVRGRPLNRFLSFEKSKEAKLPVENGKTTADDLFKKVAGKLTVGEETAAKRAAEEAKKAEEDRFKVVSLWKETKILIDRCYSSRIKKRDEFFCAVARVHAKESVCNAYDLVMEWVKQKGGRKLENEKDPCENPIYVATDDSVFCLDGKASEDDSFKVGYYANAAGTLGSLIQMNNEEWKCYMKK